MKNKTRLFLLSAVALCAVPFLISAFADAPPAIGAPAKAETPARNPTWAVPMPATAGVSNFNKMTDNIYRSAQPTAEGFKNLEKLGIKTVINLRDMHDDADVAKGTALVLVREPIKTWNIKDEQVIRVMKLLAQKEKGPCLIHCQHGADRTGTMCAMYRILVQEWTKEQALDELQNGGYGFHTMWKNIITYIQNADIATLKAAIAAPVEARKAPVVPAMPGQPPAAVPVPAAT